MSEVHFCNLCDQSVPLVEIEEGGATRMGDRVICGACRSVLHVAAGPSRRSSGGNMFLPLLVGLIGWAGLAFVWLEIDRSRETQSVELGGSLQELQIGIDGLGQSLDRRMKEAQEARGLLESRIEGMRSAQDEAIQALGTRIDGLGGQMDEFGRYVAEQEQIVARLGQVEGSVAVLEDHQRAMRAAQESMRDELGRMEDMIRTAIESGAVAGGAGGGSEPSNDFAPEVATLLRQLQDDDNETRYAALEKLAELHDERLLPHLYPMLADPYEFTRFLAAHTFGDWGAKEAVPHLIEALMDEFAFVREAGARSLRRLTGQNFGYDPRGSEDQIRKGHRAWKTWWEANGKAFLGAGG